MITLLIANKSSQEHSSKDTSNYRLAFQAGGACYVPELVRMWKRVRKHDDTTPERKYVSCVFVWWISNFTSSQDNIHSLDYFDEKAFFDSFDRWTLTDERIVNYWGMDKKLASKAFITTDQQRSKSQGASGTKPGAGSDTNSSMHSRLHLM